MKEIEKLIELLKEVNGGDREAYPIYGKEAEIVQAISAVESMLSRAKVFEFEPKNIITSLNNDSAIAMQKEAGRWHDAGIPFKLILIPEADNDR